MARVECSESHRWLNAVNRAAVELFCSHWSFDGEVLSIESATTPGTRYLVDTHGCTCSAGAHGKPCKHRAAWRLLIKAAEIHARQPKPRRTPEDHARIMAEAAELAKEAVMLWNEDDRQLIALARELMLEEGLNEVEAIREAQ